MNYSDHIELNCEVNVPVSKFLDRVSIKDIINHIGEQDLLCVISEETIVDHLRYNGYIVKKANE